MNAGQPRQVQFFVVCAPGVDPSSVNVDPQVTKLGWKFAEMSDADLIDITKQVDINISALEKWVEAAKGVLKNRLAVPTDPGTETVTRGTRYEAVYSKSVRTALDQEKTKAYFTAQGNLQDYMKTTEVLMLKFREVTQTPEAPAA